MNKKTILSTIAVLATGLALFMAYLTLPPGEPKLKTAEPAPTDWLFNQRAYPHNHIDYQAYRDAVRQTRLAKSSVMNRGNEAWEVAGPLNIGGRITDIALHPTDPNIIYAGASVGGVFKSTDGGVSWEAVFENEGALSIGNIALAPSDPDILYVGTGEANGEFASGAFFGDGVYRSVNGGESWQYLGLENSQHIGRIVVDPQDPDRVFVAAAGILYGKDEHKGLYRTEDGGQNWEKVLFVSDSTSCIDVAMNPQNPDILYASTWERIRRPWQRSYGGVTSRLYRSQDGGDTWAPLANGLPPSDEERGRIGIAVSPSDPAILYATFTTDRITNVFDGIYKSLDGGDSWFRVDNGTIDNIYSSFGWFFGNIRVDPTNPDVVYAMGVTLHKSIDGGVSWEDITYMHVDQHGLEIHPVNPNFVVAGNDGGIYLSQNGGNSWDHVEVLPLTQFYECEIDFLQPERIYGGAQDNGTMRTLTGGDNDWGQILGGDGFHVIVDPTDNDIIYAEYQWGSLFRSDDGGFDFGFIFNGGNNDRTNWNTPVVMDPSNPEVIYYGANRLYRSPDRGNSWSPISGDLTDGLHPSGSLAFGTITSIAVAPANPEVIYVGTDDGNVQVTQDGGLSWENVSDGLPKRFVTEVAVDPYDELVAYVTLSGYRFVDYQPHVLRTADAGQTWEDISGNLPEIPINDIIIDPAYDQTLYIANDLGVWHTTDLGQNWEVLGNNLPMTVVNDLDFHPDTRILLAATYGRSIQKYQLEEVMTGTSGEVVSGSNNLEISPNPVQESATVRFELPRPVNARMELFSLSGQKVKTIADQQFEAGQNQVQLDASVLPGGQYLVRLYSRDKIWTGRFVK
ncbi:MAG: T9SS type A sorting domain-containing protein [Lewinellaceae bacterium]|nr:T9SS type A sorting domain-containing protein [Phaeodactylibacter sp.]MCB9037927.1 T9SS type A sorting domain-containing protein [Lewinellaceae bacterium]